MKPIQWDVMSVRERFFLLQNFDFSDVQGGPAQWVESDWQHLPKEVKQVIRYLIVR